jgi:RNA polymerase sigma factor (sigma-70 family)
MSQVPLLFNSEPGYQLLDQAIQTLFCSRSDLTDVQKATIWRILQANLSSGRISRCFKGYSSEQADEFLVDYVASVADHYLTENPDLLLLQAGSPEAWSNLRQWLARCAHARLQRLDGLKELAGYTADDFVNEISLWLLETFYELDAPAQDGKHSPAAGLAIGYTYDVPFSAWIAKVQSNHVIDALRRSRRQGWTKYTDELTPSEDTIDAVLTRTALEQEIPQLTPYQQEVLEQLYAQGVSAEEAAQWLGCTRRAVYNRTHAAITRLRNKFH